MTRKQIAEKVAALTDAQVAEYMNTTDKMVWVEYEVFNGEISACTNRGEAAIEHAEVLIEKRAA